MTAYLILEKKKVVEAEGAAWVEDGPKAIDGWVEIATVEADNADGALRKYFKDPPAVAGTFVAVSARAFKPKPVKTRVSVSIGGV